MNEPRRDAVTLGVVLISLLAAASLLPLRLIPAPPAPPAPPAADPDVFAEQAAVAPNPPSGPFPLAPPLPNFPLTARWEPSWMLGRGFGYFQGPGASVTRLMSYSTADESKVITLTVEASEPSPPRSTDTSFITVLGQPATMYRFTSASGPNAFTVTWGGGDQWFRVFATGVVEDEVLYFVKGLQGSPQPMRTAVYCPYLPDTLLVQTIDSAYIYFYAPNLGGYLTVTLMPPTTQTSAGAVPVQVGARRGELLPKPYPDRAATMVRVFDDAWSGRALHVVADDQIGLSTEQLITFAATVQVDPASLLRG